MVMSTMLLFIPRMSDLMVFFYSVSAAMLFLIDSISLIALLTFSSIYLDSVVSCPVDLFSKEL